MPIPCFMGDPLGVPYGNLRISDSRLTWLDFIAVSVSASSDADVLVRTASYSGPVRFHIRVTKATSQYYPFPRPLATERGIYITANKPAVISFGGRP